MKKLSEIISKEVISLEECASVGYILDVDFDFQKRSIYGFFICDESVEVIKYLKYENIVKINDYIIIKNSNMLSFCDNYSSKTPINKKMITKEGFDCGIIKDVEINRKKIIKLLSTKCEIYARNIFNWEGKLLVISKKKICTTDKIFNVEKNVKQIVKIQNDSGTKENVHKVIFDEKVDNLKGRVVLKDILGINNELIIRREEIITDRIITLAKKHNKFSQLILNSK